MKDEKVRVLERPDNDLGMDETKTAIVIIREVLAPDRQCYSLSSVGRPEYSGVAFWQALVLGINVDESSDHQLIKVK
jgi:hypothetical protein